MSLSRRRLLGLGAGAGLAAASGGLLTACGGDERKRGGTLTVGLAAVPAVLNPVHTADGPARWIADPVVEPLYGLRSDATLRPLLAAADPQITPDGLTWTIRLRQGVRFHGGDPFTADHVVACLRRVTDPVTAGPWAPHLAGRIGEVTAPDPLTVRLTLPRPFGVLRSLLACLPIPHTATLGDPAALVGTGPFRLAGATGTEVSLVADAGYRDDAPSLEAIRFRAAPDAVAELRAGRVDLYPAPPAEQVLRLRRTGGVHLREQPAAGGPVLLPNPRRAPFSDPALRRALAAAADRTRVRQDVYKGAAVIGQGPLGPGMEGWDPEYTPYGRGLSPTSRPKPSPSATAGPTVEPERVRALLGEGGITVPPGVPFTLIVDGSGPPESAATARVLAEGWNAVGFATTVEVLDGPVWAERRRTGDFDVALADVRGVHTAGLTGLAALAPAWSADPRSTGYANPGFDRAVEEAWATTDPRRRERLTRAAGEIATRDAVIIPPVYPRLVVARTGRVGGIDDERLALGLVEVGGLYLRG